MPTFFTLQEKSAYLERMIVYAKITTRSLTQQPIKCFVLSNVSRGMVFRRNQVVSGVGLEAYWLSSYLWDSVSLIMPVAFTLVVLAAADVEALISGEAVGATILLFLMYSISMVTKSVHKNLKRWLRMELCVCVKNISGGCEEFGPLPTVARRKITAAETTMSNRLLLKFIP